MIFIMVEVLITTFPEVKGKVGCLMERGWNVHILNITFSIQALK